jgi:DNA replication and repair protein RecF
MKVRWLRLDRFRNYEQLRLKCVEETNVFLGENGQGKTNILEALSFVCLTKSFYASNEKVVLQLGADRFEVEAALESDHGTEYVVRVIYDCTSGEKNITVNKAPVEKLSSMIGQFPIVILSPENSAITFGAPAERRRFADLVISQTSGVYLDDALEYRRVLRQRNRILAVGKAERRESSSLLEPWDASLARYGARIVARRRAFAEEFLPHIETSFRTLTRGEEEPSVRYVPSIRYESGSSVDDLEKMVLDELANHRRDELRMGTTLIGPHRDEFDFAINGKELRKFASQGQHKTFLVALKVAEFHYLNERREETPLLLLDDVFSELDEPRSHRLLEVVRGLGQTFITTTDERVFPSEFSWAHAGRFIVHKASVHQQEPVGDSHEAAWHSA